jgi:acyl-CoA synthetase (NDP forming)
MYCKCKKSEAFSTHFYAVKIFSATILRKTKAQGRELPLRAAHAHFAMHAMPATCAAVANVRENLELGGFSFENTRR